ncbi:PIG-L family deacetylase [Mycobacterium sp.]|uniref:PIG-L family deacetylase n=1 Tax=Mycobacterium sp. TaxID=1785 RepID=UPI003D143CE5
MPDARPFTHRENGTDEPTWLLDARWDGVPRLGLDAVLKRYPHVVLVAPHPDDETLALGGALADMAGSAATVTVVIATHGGRGPASTERRIEAEHAISTLGSHVKTVWWNLPDGKLHNAVSEMGERLLELVDARTLLIAPIECDGHSDHEAVASSAEAVARERDAALLQYPIWLWHWAKPDDIDWDRLRTLAPSLSALAAKSAAIDCYTSQLASPDGYPVVGPAVVVRARRVMETVVVPLPRDLAARVAGDIGAHRSRAQIAAPFDTMLGDGATDPWRLDVSEYEKRRLAITLACLGRQHYPTVLEIGCATGQLSAQLRLRADQVIGMDASELALDVARARPDTVEWLLGAAPADIPDREFDLIVLSEVAYFLDGPELLATLRAARRQLRPHGEILIANWSAPTENIPLDGPTVDAQAAAIFALPRRAGYQDADLTIQVWGEPVSVYRECAGTQ